MDDGGRGIVARPKVENPMELLSSCHRETPEVRIVRENEPTQSQTLTQELCIVPTAPARLVGRNDIDALAAEVGDDLHSDAHIR